MYICGTRDEFDHLHVTTWKNSQTITEQILPYTDQKKRISVPPQLLPHLRNKLYCICFPAFLSEHWCILCFSPFQISPENQMSNEELLCMLL